MDKEFYKNEILRLCALIDIAVGRVVDMVGGAFVLQHELRADVDTFLQRVDRGIGFDQLFGAVHQHFFDQRGQIGIVVVKGVARNTAVIGDILDGDAVDGLAVEQLDKGVMDGFLR